MPTQEKNIDLLAQRLEQGERALSVLNKKVDELTAANAKLEGQQAQQDKSQNNINRWAPWALGLVFGAIMTFGGNFILNRIDNNHNDITALQIDTAERFTRKDLRLIALEARSAPSLGPLEARMVSAESAIQRLDLGVSEHEEEIDQLEAEFGISNRQMASIQASAGASFVEVETQLRAINEVMNVRQSENNRIDQLLWTQSFGTTLPDQEFFPTDIPAKATTQVGKVNGN